MSILETINSPSDLKKLHRSRLPELAGEIRDVIVRTVSENGGHLASNLGAVELTLAIHYVFDIPEDKVIWDVGHQAYTHKLLTGRRDSFHTLRKYQGLSGFPKRSENPCDAFTTGHSSTSISAGLGIAAAKRLNSDAKKTIAVIGDGSLTGGIAYEGLNQAGDSDKNILVILNDNEMSIAPNVGALSGFLSRTLSATFLQNLRTHVGEFLKGLPKIGGDMYQLAKRSEESFKTFVTPGMLFEAFDFDYFGPIDGHNLDHLIDILNNIKALNEPVLLHVTSKKGQGYAFAEENPSYFHGVGSFDAKTGTSAAKKSGPPSYTKVFGETLMAMAEKNPAIVAITAAMPEGTGLTGFSEAYPDRFFDVGIAEQHGVTFSAGMATEGFRPVVAIYSTFLQRAYDQIIHDVCMDNLPVTFAIDRGGIVGEDGTTHQGLFDFSFLRSLPNMVVMAPKDENELRRMLATALTHDGPCAVRYPRGAGEGVTMDQTIEPLPVGKGQVLVSGEDLLILAIGRTVGEALNAAGRLAAEGISATVVNCRFVKPLDGDLIASLAARIPHIITVEEHVRQGGFGSAVLECLADADVSYSSLTRLGIEDTFVEHGPQKVLRHKHGIDADGIFAAGCRVAPAETAGNRPPLSILN